MTTLTLGTFTFQTFAVPERINGGGPQSLSEKRLVGGKKSVDAMGSFDDDIAFSGLFLQSDAELKIVELQSFKSLGVPLPLIYSTFFYLVAIKEFTYHFERNYQIRYNMVVTVIENLSNPVDDATNISYDDSINQLLNTSNSLSGSIDNTNITNSMTSVNNAFDQVPSVQNATTAQLATLQAPVQNAQSVVESETETLNSATFSGNLDVDQLADNLQTLSDMYVLQSVLTEIFKNISLIETGSTGLKITISGGSLYQLAARYYGDALKWTTIAEANGFFDPEIPAGVATTLVIPVASSDTGGVLTQ